MIEFIKKHWVLLGGGVVGLYIVYEYLLGGSSSSSSTASSGSSDYAAAIAASQQYSAQAAQSSLAAQTESDQATAAQNTLNAQTQVALAQNDTAAAAAIGNTLSTVISAQSALPIAAINAAGGQNQAALLGGAQAAASALGAVPGALQGSAGILAASYSPLNTYGKAVGTSAAVGAAGSFGSNVASMTQAAASTANASLNRPQNSSSSSLLTGVALAAAFL
jgi:hypothetical protein